MTVLPGPVPARTMGPPRPRPRPDRERIEIEAGA